MKASWTAGAVLAAMVLLAAAGSAEASWGSWLGCGDECGTTRAELMTLQCVAEATQERGWAALAGYLEQESLPDEACPLLDEKIEELGTPSRFTAWIDGVCGEHTAADLADHLEAIASSSTVKWHCASGEFIDSVLADRNEVIDKERISAE